ncbi:MAG: hypothetical protein AAGJ93_00750 [Bacteroidota bacterium]
MSDDQKYPAKILLFGEHTILRGSCALAMPWWKRYSKWEQAADTTQQADLLQLAVYLDQEFPHLFQTHQLRQDLDDGYYLYSTIPTGYGLGSSGTVCVAVFDRYATATARRKVSLLGAKPFFAQMESFFHGSSSGTDPLIIYQQQSIQLFPDGTISDVDIPALPKNWCFFLLDTKKARQTGPLVNYFTERFDTDTNFQQRTKRHWIPATNEAINALLQQDMPSLWQAFKSISQFQLAELPPMVLPLVQSAWKKGLSSELYLLKICGAGGGGFCLGLTQNWKQTQQALKDWELILL